MAIGRFLRIGNGSGNRVETKRIALNNDSGAALAELAICLPILGLLFTSVITYGQVRKLEGAVSISSYLAAVSESKYRNGKEVAFGYLESRGYKDKEMITVNVRKTLSLPYQVHEAEVSVKVRTRGFMRFLKDDYHYVKSRTEWYSSIAVPVK